MLHRNLKRNKEKGNKSAKYNLSKKIIPFLWFHSRNIAKVLKSVG